MTALFRSVVIEPDYWILGLATQFGDEDYLLLEVQSRMGCSHFTRHEFQLLEGEMPAWAAFPNAWHEWVCDPAVRLSAITHILFRYPCLTMRIAELESSFDKHNIQKKLLKPGWDEIAMSLFGLTYSGVSIIEKCQSKTGIAAMPIRIAQTIGDWDITHLPPRPFFNQSDRSKRVAVASIDLSTQEVQIDPVHLFNSVAI